MEKILCKLGFHKYVDREVHFDEALLEGGTARAAVFSKCVRCGHIEMVGSLQQTKVVVPGKFAIRI